MLLVDHLQEHVDVHAPPEYNFAQDYPDGAVQQSEETQAADGYYPADNDYDKQYDKQMQQGYQPQAYHQDIPQGSPDPGYQQHQPLYPPPSQHHNGQRQTGAYYIPPRPSPLNGPYYNGGLADYRRPSPYFDDSYNSRANRSDHNGGTGYYGKPGNASQASAYRRDGEDRAERMAVAEQEEPYAPTYMCCSILNCLCCCCLLGIVAIAFSQRTQEANYEGW